MVIYLEGPEGFTRLCRIQAENTIPEERSSSRHPGTSLLRWTGRYRRFPRRPHQIHLCDNNPCYLKCLQGIAAGRNCEEIATQVAIEASDEKLSYRDIRAAYKELGLVAQAQLEDNMILGTFHSGIVDDPKQEAEMRGALKVIGQGRILLPTMAAFEKTGIKMDLDHGEWDLGEAPSSKEELENRCGTKLDRKSGTDTRA